jgi:membrane-associated phospholipid phosphatase
MDKKRYHQCFWAAAVFVLSAAGIGRSPVMADSPARKASDFASGTGNIIYLGAALGLPLLADGKDGRNHALRTADAIGTSLLLTEGLKSLVREKRPDSDAHDSFPSGHATAAFAAATAESGLHPKQAPLWYLGATLISYSRVRLHRHYDRDVVAGALIGYGTARLELSAPRGLILSPLISPDTHSYGLQVSSTWR